MDWLLGVLLEANYFGKPSDAFKLYGSKAKLETGAKFCMLRQRTKDKRARVHPESMKHSESDNFFQVAPPKQTGVLK